MVQEKYLDGNMLIAQKMGLPSLLQQSTIVSNSLHITQNLSGIPPYKLKFFKEVFFPLHKAKQSPDEDNDKRERIPALTTRQLCEAYNERTGKTITTNNLKQNYLNEFISNGLVDEEDSILDKRQKIYYPLIDLPTANQNSREKIRKLSISDRLDNILEHPLILMPKNCNNISDNWLELEIFGLIKYPSKLDKFELYNERGEQICICRFVKDYEKKCRLNGYF